VKRLGDDVLRNGSIPGSLIGVSIDRIDITFIEGAESDRI